ncbi:T3SS (YopN, CesT) and YbjN peptide-binding chaperone 1 [Rhodococcus chondri]|uniref:YbjN domain-containing protein n=1 Tax=Rhodococcus chondri TaxID=3065941 RepID=A0ABU7JVI8_9NOCA|nr:hypothetical protein [Rhodococcus sp. CC-R104]MEE2034043.1 hypothetical protein [Rhodococcus sp. CC-R104]
MAERQNIFDRDVDRAWRAFRAHLADHVAAMHDDDGLVLEPLAEESGGPAGPCVQFYAWGDGQVRCEVPSNTHLADDRRLQPGDEALLQELGWQPPSRGPEDPEDTGSPAFWLDRPSSWADQLADIAVTVLRRIWGVPHPLFLRSETFGADHTPVFEPPTPSIEERTRKSAVALAVEPTGEEHIRELIEATMQDRIGESPTWDEDGDLVLRVGGVLLFVGVGPGGTTVDLFAPVVHSITGRTRAAEVVADLNRRWPHLKFVLVDDRVAVVNHLAAIPFVPAHLLAALDRLAAFLEDLDPQFATHLGGVLLRESENPDMSDPFDEPEWTPDVEDDLPPALLALRDHHLEGSSGVPVRTVAAIGEWEPARLQQFLDLSTEQQIGWTSESLDRAVAGDDDGVFEADSKALEWELTIRSLTKALEYMERSTDGPSRRASSPRPAVGEQPALFDNPDEPTLFDGSGE